MSSFQSFICEIYAEARSTNQPLAFASFEPEPGLKFTNIYEVYSQRFQREDFDEDQKFDPKVLPSSYLTDPQPGHAFVYVSTIQRMTINLLGRDAIFDAGDEELDEDATKLDIPIHAFDLVIADECHRGNGARTDRGRGQGLRRCGCETQMSDLRWRVHADSSCRARGDPMLSVDRPAA